tara:strand:- start:980 stop:1117 length:138 start_codon:yes stop_codon:yes gene_type:complete
LVGFKRSTTRFRLDLQGHIDRFPPKRLFELVILQITVEIRKGEKI